MVLCFISCGNKYHYIHYPNSKTKYTVGYFDEIRYMIIYNYHNDTTLKFTLSYIDKSNANYFQPEIKKYYKKETKSKYSGLLYTNIDFNDSICFYYYNWKLRCDTTNINNKEIVSKHDLTIYNDAITAFCNGQKKNSAYFHICDSLPLRTLNSIEYKNSE